MRHAALTFLAISLFAASAIGQSGVSPSNVQWANLEQDVRILQREVGRLRIEIEAVTRENEQLRKALQDQLQSGRDQMVTLATLNSRLEQLRGQLTAAIATSRQELVKEVSAEIERLATQTQAALKALAGSVSAQPQVAQTVVFNDNYPKTGSPYTVKSGDSLARIARAMNSRVEWIRNANRLPNDTIFPGQELFIPQQD